MLQVESITLRFSLLGRMTPVWSHDPIAFAQPSRSLRWNGNQLIGFDREASVPTLTVRSLTVSPEHQLIRYFVMRHQHHETSSSVGATSLDRRRTVPLDRLDNFAMAALLALHRNGDDGVHGRQ